MSLISEKLLWRTTRPGACLSAGPWAGQQNFCFSFLRRHSVPRFYRVYCPKCDHAENVELCPSGETCGEEPNHPGGDECRKIAELPKHCLVCNARLKALRIPVSIHY